MLILAAPEAAALNTPCGSLIGTSEIAIDLSGATAVLRIYDRTGALVAPDSVFGQPNTGGLTAIQLESSVSGDCDYFVGFPPGGDRPGPSKYILFTRSVAFPITVEIERYSFRPGAAAGEGPDYNGTDRFVYGTSLLDSIDSFFRPGGTGDNGDVYLKIEPERVRVSPDDFWPLNGAAGMFIDEVIPDDGWVFPYHAEAICAASSCGSAQNGSGQNSSSQTSSLIPFLMPVDTVFVYGQPLVKHLTPAVSMTFSAQRTINWTEGWLTLAFAPGTSLLTESPDFRVSDVSLVASDAAQGWGGLAFQPGATGTLSGVTVSGARYVQPAGTTLLAPYPPGAAVTVNDATVTITGASNITGGGPTVPGTLAPNGGTVFGLNGIGITGTSATVTVTGGSFVTDNDGLGIVASGGAHVLVDGGSSVTVNGRGGIRALGDGTQATVTGYAQVNGNFSVGVRADERALVSVRSPSGLDNTSISDNVGGPTAGTAASIDGGQCTPAGATGRPNVFELNTDGAYDAAASGGAAVVARYAFWGLNAQLVGRSFGELVLVVGKSGMVSANPTAVSRSTPDPTCPAIMEGRSEGSSTTRPFAGALLSAGRASETVVALAAAAREAAWAGDPDAAFASLAEAGAAAVSDDDREAVFGATAALLSDTQPADVVADLEAGASSGTAEAPWARRALAVAYAALGRTGEADAVAASLAGIHAATGHGLRVRLAVDAGDEALALARLVAFAEDGDASGDDEAFGSALALVAATFPDADLSSVPGSLVAGTTSAGKTGDSGESPAAEGRLADAVDVYPNPAVDRAVVRLSLASPVEQAVAVVYDALGRRVAVLHDGPLGAGATVLAFDAASLPAGVYVVQIRVARSTGAAWTAVRRVTIAR